MPELHPEQFGMTEREAAEIKGRALGAHIWEGMEGVFGDLRKASQGDAYSDLSHRFGTSNVQISEDDDPYFEIKEGPYALRYHGGPTMNYYAHGENVDAGTRYDHKDWLSSDFQNDLQGWIKDVGYAD